MPDSMTELAKLFLPANRRKGFDKRMLVADQKKVIATGEMLKFMRGLVTLADWLEHEYEDGALVSLLIEHCFIRSDLYKKLYWAGYTWDENTRLWRLIRGRKHARRLHHSEAD